MPGIWFGSTQYSGTNNQGPSHTNEELVENVQVHHVRIEHEACGSSDYLDTGEYAHSSTDLSHDKGEVDATVPRGQGNCIDDYDECDELLPKHNNPKKDDKEAVKHAKEERKGPMEKQHSEEYFDSYTKGEHSISSNSGSFTSTSNSATQESPTATVGLSSDSNTVNSSSQPSDIQEKIIEAGVRENISKHLVYVTKSKEGMASKTLSVQDGLHEERNKNSDDANYCNCLDLDEVNVDVTTPPFKEENYADIHKRKSF